MLLLYHTSCLDASALWARGYEYKGETIKNCLVDFVVSTAIYYAGEYIIHSRLDSK